MTHRTMCALIENETDCYPYMSIRLTLNNSFNGTGWGESYSEITNLFKHIVQKLYKNRE